MAKSRKRSILFLVAIIIISISLGYFVLNEFGLVRYLTLKQKVDNLNERILKLEEENDRLASEIDSLKKEIPAKIERTARERYDMKRPNEIKIEVKEE